MLPMIGKGTPGWACVQRIISDIKAPMKAQTIPMTRNCLAMTLWSVEKTYFLMKLVGSGWMCCSNGS
jgi:hypothetical protein